MFLDDFFCIDFCCFMKGNWFFVLWCIDYFWIVFIFIFFCFGNSVFYIIYKVDIDIKFFCYMYGYGLIWYKFWFCGYNCFFCCVLWKFILCLCLVGFIVDIWEYYEFYKFFNECRFFCMDSVDDF